MTGDEEEDNRLRSSGTRGGWRGGTGISKYDHFLLCYHPAGSVIEDLNRFASGVRIFPLLDSLALPRVDSGSKIM